MTEGTTEESTIGPFHKEVLVVTLTILALVTVTAFETMAVSTAMPNVARDLGFVRTYGFAFSVLMTTQLIGIVLAGVWADRSGPIPGTFAGQVLLGGGSALCGFADSSALFLLGRGLTGLGGGLLVVMMYIIAGRVYTDAVRPTLFVYISAAWILPSLIGPPMSAFLTTHFSWRWVFWIVVLPVIITLASMAYASRHVERLQLHAGESNRDHAAHVKAAWAGVLIALSAGAVQYGIDDLHLEMSAKTVVGGIGAVGLLVTAPLLVPRGTWTVRRGLPSVILSRSLLTGSFFGGVSFLPLFLHGQRGASLQLAGLAIAVGSLGWAVGAYIQGRDRFAHDRHRLIALGGALLAVGLASLAVIAAANFKGGLGVLSLILCGLGMGLGVTTTTVLALELSSVADHGETSSALQLSDVLGSVLGIALATALFAAHHVPKQDNPLFGVIFALMAAIAALVVVSGQRSST